MKKRILLLPLILVNAMHSAYALGSESKKIAEQSAASSAAHNNDAHVSYFLLLPDELKLKIIESGIASFNSYKEAWSFVASLSRVNHFLHTICKDKDIIHSLSQVLSDEEKRNLLFSPGIKQIRDKRQIGTYAANMMVQAHKHAGIDLDQFVPEGDLHNTALMLEAQFGKPEMVQALIQAGADMNVKNPPYGYTALMQAAVNYKPEIVKLLLDASADISIKNEYDSNVLQLILSFLGHSWIENKDKKTLEHIYHMIESHEVSQPLLEATAQNSSNNNMEV